MTAVTARTDQDWIGFHCNLDPDLVAEDLIHRDAEDQRSGMTPAKLHALMYLAQGQHLASTHERLFADRIEAGSQGPIVPSQTDRFSGADAVTRIHPSADAIPYDTGEFLGRVWQMYGSMGAAELIELVRSQDPWRTAHLNDATVITDLAMTRYFERQRTDSRIFSTAVTLVPAGLFDDTDIDDMARQMADALR